MSINDAIYPVLDFTGDTVAVTVSRAEIMRHAFVVHHHDRFPGFGSRVSLAIRQVAPGCYQSVSSVVGYPLILVFMSELTEFDCT